ncbi:hypothetical protein ACJX0J_024093, partial [Zea mays]
CFDSSLEAYLPYIGEQIPLSDVGLEILNSIHIGAVCLYEELSKTGFEQVWYGLAAVIRTISILCFDSSLEAYLPYIGEQIPLSDVGLEILNSIHIGVVCLYEEL